MATDGRTDRGKAITEKIYHFADKVNDAGNVRPICSRKAINLKVATWTLRERAVTCAKCLKLLGRKKGGKE